MAALAIIAAAVGGYLMYNAYEAIHNKGAAAPVKKATAAL